MGGLCSGVWRLALRALEDAEDTGVSGTLSAMGGSEPRQELLGEMADDHREWTECTERGEARELRPSTLPT